MNETHIFVMNDALMTMKIFIDDEDEGTKTHNSMTVDGYMVMVGWSYWPWICLLGELFLRILRW